MITSDAPPTLTHRPPDALPPLSKLTLKKSGVLNAVVVYETFEDGVRVRGLLERLAAASGHELRFDIRAWDYASLCGPDETMPDITRADGADCMIVAAGIDDALPSAVTRWIECCIADNPQGPGVIVGVKPADAPMRSRFHASIHAVADKWRVQFLRGIEFEMRMMGDLAWRLLTRQPAGARRFSDSWSQMPARYEHTGINE